MRHGRYLLVALAWMPTLALADGVTGEGVAWLQKIATVAHQLNYSGTFVYRHGSYMETSRIVHVSDESGEHEKLEVLDGPPRELIRNNDEVICFVPDSKTVFVEKRKARKSFPALLPQQISGISENYVIKLDGSGRVAGHDCQYVVLEPRDIYRYGHRLCADLASGLLLKASTLSDKNEMVDQFAFTQVSVGIPIEREQLQSRFSGNRTPVDQSAKMVAADPRWQVNSPPPGFKKIMALKRSFPGKKYPANHLVFSDELAAVSVFIEPMAGVEKPMSGLSSQGAINVYTRPVGDHQVTVLGEVPSATVMQMANSTAFLAR